jgi:plasmid maintenance system killer protein
LEIAFHPKIRKVCEDKDWAARKLGSERAKLLQRRLEQLRYAESLEVMRNIQQARCHELKGDRAGQLAVDLKHPYRLIFEVADDPIPMQPTGGLDWKNVRSIRILEVVDYHD